MKEPLPGACILQTAVRQEVPSALCVKTRSLTDQPDFTGHSWLFFSKERHMSKSCCLKVSQNETVCFNSLKPLGFVLFWLHLSSFSMVAETPKTNQPANQTTSLFWQLSKENPIFSLPTSLIWYLVIDLQPLHLGTIFHNPAPVRHRLLQRPKVTEGRRTLLASV